VGTRTNSLVAELVSQFVHSQQRDLEHIQVGDSLLADDVFCKLVITMYDQAKSHGVDLAEYINFDFEDPARRSHHYTYEVRRTIIRLCVTCLASARR
jgi:hypothetical protein